MNIPLFGNLPSLFVDVLGYSGEAMIPRSSDLKKGLEYSNTEALYLSLQSHNLYTLCGSCLTPLHVLRYFEHQSASQAKQGSDDATSVGCTCCSGKAG
jgi:hypothetical protein